MNSNNITAKREAKQRAKHAEVVRFYRQILNEDPPPFQYRPAKAKPKAPPLRTLARAANRRALPYVPSVASGSLSKRQTDAGDPVITAPSAYARGFSAQQANFQRLRDGVVIRKRELLAPISGTSAFTIALLYNLNPGLVSSFPWLSTQAAGWEQYKFRKLRYTYYTRASSATAGSMMLVPDYDAADAAPISEQQCMDYKDAKEEAPWVPEFCCDLDPTAMHPGGARKFIRQGAVANTDIKTYDAGVFYAITSDGSATNWGKLFVEYEVELSVSQLPSTLSTVSVGTSTTSTTANALAGMTYTNGTLILSGTANTLSWTGAVSGQEYLFTIGGTSGSAIVTPSTLTGGSVKTNTNGGNGMNFTYSFTATAATGSLVLSETTANAGTVLLSLSAIPTVAL